MIVSTMIWTQEENRPPPFLASITNCFYNATKIANGQFTTAVHRSQRLTIASEKKISQIDESVTTVSKEHTRLTQRTKHFTYATDSNLQSTDLGNAPVMVMHSSGYVPVMEIHQSG